MIYPVVLYGDPVLKQKARSVDKNELDPEFIESMYETMYGAGGVGLAAPQIGESIRVFIVDSGPMEDDGVEGLKKTFINAEMIKESGRAWPFEEGCLSIPGIREDVLRPPEIVIRYFDENWEQKEEKFVGMHARIIQHEYDHIEGKLFTDYLSPLKKRLLKGKLANISKGKTDIEYRVKAPLKK